MKLGLLGLIGGSIAAPAASRQISIQVQTRDNGPGSINVNSNGEEYSREWEQLTPDVSEEINEQLDAMGLGGGFSDGQFQFEAPNFPALIADVASNNGNAVSSSKTLEFSVNNAEDFAAEFEQQEQKILDWVRQYSEDFYNTVKAQLDQIGSSLDS
ncbi:Oidioi.mRNA.OKI2018_I69.chr2.g6251.t1.cds [Oikopleura dioica]|uniref:Oidioi.mRNA.OKI2018_I69.chr2.g6251.t1.cds n=1 Tax=Oikopleura dioica TaxID=34765 RepID=A0ABN7T2Z8_OIKDI|nr:Oidioi.mRNA.OKI2018_I69.chr2.g6251.t1.cds [Oikopleura dioica]